MFSSCWNVWATLIFSLLSTRWNGAICLQLWVFLLIFLDISSRPDVNVQDLRKPILAGIAGCLSVHMPKVVSCWGLGRDFLYQEQHTKSQKHSEGGKSSHSFRASATCSLDRDIPKGTCQPFAQETSLILASLWLSVYHSNYSTFSRRKPWHPVPTCCIKAA